MIDTGRVRRMSLLGTWARAGLNHGVNRQIELRDACAYVRPVVRFSPARKALMRTASKPMCTREARVSR